MRIRALQMVSKLPSPPSNNFCNKASHAAKDISNRALNDDDNEQTDRSAREKKEEKGKT